MINEKSKKNRKKFFVLILTVIILLLLSILITFPKEKLFYTKGEQKSVESVNVEFSNTYISTINLSVMRDQNDITAERNYNNSLYARKEDQIKFEFGGKPTFPNGTELTGTIEFKYMSSDGQEKTKVYSSDAGDLLCEVVSGNAFLRYTINLNSDETMKNIKLIKMNFVGIEYINSSEGVDLPIIIDNTAPILTYYYDAPGSQGTISPTTDSSGYPTITSNEKLKDYSVHVLTKKGLIAELKSNKITYENKTITIKESYLDIETICMVAHDYAGNEVDLHYRPTYSTLERMNQINPLISIEKNYNFISKEGDRYSVKEEDNLKQKDSIRVSGYVDTDKLYIAKSNGKYVEANKDNESSNDTLNCWNYTFDEKFGDNNLLKLRLGTGENYKNVKCSLCHQKLATTSNSEDKSYGYNPVTFANVSIDTTAPKVLQMGMDIKARKENTKVFYKESNNATPSDITENISIGIQDKDVFTSMNVDKTGLNTTIAKTTGTFYIKGDVIPRVTCVFDENIIHYNMRVNAYVQYAGGNGMTEFLNEKHSDKHKNDNEDKRKVWYCAPEGDNTDQWDALNDALDNMEKNNSKEGEIVYQVKVRDDVGNESKIYKNNTKENPTDTGARIVVDRKGPEISITPNVQYVKNNKLIDNSQTTIPFTLNVNDGDGVGVVGTKIDLNKIKVSLQGVQQGSAYVSVSNSSLTTSKENEMSLIGFVTNAESATITIEKGAIKDLLDNENEELTYTITRTPIYTIIYDTQEGSQAPEKQTYEKDQAVTISSVVPTRIGYTFNGWQSSLDSSKIYNPGATINTNDSIINASMTLKAQWKANTNTKYKVIHIRQNLDGNFNASDNSLTETLYETGTTSAPVTPSVKNYVGFDSPNAQTEAIKGDGSTEIIYRYNRKSYTYTLGSCDGVSTNGSTQTGTYKYEAPIELNASIIDSAYEWDKWKCDNIDSLSTTALNTTFKMPASNITMTPTAQVKKYNVIYNANTIDGRTVVGSVPTTENIAYKSIVTVKFPELTMIGYTFKGWSTNPNAKEAEYTNTGEKTFSMPSKDVNLYAVWKDEKKPEVDFETNGAKYVIDSEKGNAIIKTKVTVTDDGSNVNANSLKYEWSNASSPEKLLFNNSFSNGEIIETTLDNSSSIVYLWIKCSDNAGNMTYSRSEVFQRVDDTITFGPSTTEITNKDVEVDVSCGESLSINKISCTGKNNIDYIINDKKVTIKTNGQTITVEASDSMGNKIIKTYLVNNIDKNKPTNLSIAYSKKENVKEVKIRVKADGKCSYSINGNKEVEKKSDNVFIIKGNGEYTVTATNERGNSISKKITINNIKN